MRKNGHVVVLLMFGMWKDCSNDTLKHHTAEIALLAWHVYVSSMLLHSISSRHVS